MQITVRFTYIMQDEVTTSVPDDYESKQVTDAAETVARTQKPGLATLTALSWQQLPTGRFGGRAY